MKTNHEMRLRWPRLFFPSHVACRLSLVLFLSFISFHFFFVALLPPPLHTKLSASCLSVCMAGWLPRLRRQSFSFESLDGCIFAPSLDAISLSISIALSGCVTPTLPSPLLFFVSSFLSSVAFTVGFVLSLLLVCAPSDLLCWRCICVVYIVYVSCGCPIPPHPVRV